MLTNFRTYQMAVALYHETESLNLVEPLKDQFNRAKLSVVLNLAEGSAKPTMRDRKKFYHIAFGSLREVQALLILIKNPDLSKKADQLAANLYKLCKS